MYQKHMFAKSYDPLSEKFYPILVSPKGFVKIFVPCMGKYLSSAGYLSKKAKYYRVSVKQKNGKKKYYYVHRIVAETFCERPAKILKIVHHLNNNSFDNRAENLEWTSVGLNCLMKKTSLLYESVQYENQEYFQPRFHWKGNKILSAQIFETPEKARQSGLKIRQYFYDEERARLIDEEEEREREAFSFIPDEE